MKYILLSVIFLAAGCVETQKPEAVFIQTDQHASRNLPFSQAVRYGDLLFVSGQIGELENGEVIKGGIIPETTQTMLNIQKILEANGSSMENVIKCTCMLADIDDWARMSSAYVKFFPKHKPARSAFATTGLAMGAKVEIECIATVE
ncbi:RidA family protein [Fulvivirga sedimenti]|uniref:RidA family protein n=1 Tax=Fulvivirga sedimenti TaxID=2879465 RepID=A0A9X1KVK6_9BACT|nr:RidA family protein [Fulvivirga sedimenti]MCA6073805.1 RidA family protein [Fulvivirga sedimenti]